MIKVENIETWGLDHAIRCMRNPMNSWDKSDSHKCDWEVSSGRSPKEIFRDERQEILASPYKDVAFELQSKKNHYNEL